MSREMKHSGIEWVGEIPKEWKVIRGKYLFEVLNGFAFDSSLFTKESHYTPLIRIRDISNANTEAYYMGDYSLEYIVKKGEVLVGMDGDFNVAKWKGIDALLNQRVCKLSGFSENCLSQYVFYILPLLLKGKNDVTYATTVKHLSSNDILNFSYLVPSLSEQQKIADYLDKVSGEVDEMIALQEQMIEELKAYKQSIITEAVTKGLNPNVPMKNSGIDWIGEIPEHWKIIRIKYLLDERKERSAKGLEEPLSMSQKFGLIPTKEMDMIPNIASSFVGAKLVYKNDLVFNKLKAHLGVFSVSDYDGLVSPDYAVYYSPGMAEVKYLEYLFKTPQYIGEFIKLSSGVGAGLTRLYTSDLYSIKAILPPIYEQKKISEFIKNKSFEIDSLVAIKQQKIEELKEYKNSIIYEYVTGKKEVPYGE